MFQEKGGPSNSFSQRQNSFGQGDAFFSYQGEPLSQTEQHHSGQHLTTKPMFSHKQSLKPTGLKSPCSIMNCEVFEGSWNDERRTSVWLRRLRAPFTMEPIKRQHNHHTIAATHTGIHRCLVPLCSPLPQDQPCPIMLRLRWARQSLFNFPLRLCQPSTPLESFLFLPHLFLRKVSLSLRLFYEDQA